MDNEIQDFCEGLVESVGTWVSQMNAAIDLPPGKRVFLNEQAFKRVQPLLRRADPSDRAAVLTDLGVALVHSFLEQLERGPLHVGGTARLMNPDLNDSFITAAAKAGLLK